MPVGFGSIRAAELQFQHLWLQVCHWEETLSWVWIKGWTGGVVYRVFSSCSTRTNSQQALQPQPQLVARFQAFQESAFTAGGAWSISCFSTGGWCLQSCPGSCTACGWSQCLGRDFGVNLESNQDSKFWVIKDCCILKFIQASLNQNWFLH